MSLNKLNGCAIRELHGVGQWASAQACLNGHKNLFFTVIPYENEHLLGSYLSLARLKAIRQALQFQPFIVFSDHATGVSGGEQLAQLIQNKKLGTLHATAPRMNWTNNKIITYLWEVDYAALKKYFEELGEEITPLSLAAMAALESPKVATPPPQPTPAPTAAGQLETDYTGNQIRFI